MQSRSESHHHDEKPQTIETTPEYGGNSTAASTPTLAKSEECLSPRETLPVTDKGSRPPAPDTSANALSRLTFHWIGGVLRNGFKRPLRVDDIPLINPLHGVDHGVADEIQALFDQYSDRGDKFPLWQALYDTFKREFWIGGLCRGVADILLVVTPYTLRFLIQFAIDSYNAGKRNEVAPPISHGIGLLVGIVSMLAIQTMCHNQFMYLLGVIGGQTRAVLVASIFDKSMRIRGRGSTKVEDEPEITEKGTESSKGKKYPTDQPAGPDYTVGQLTNLVSVDCTRIDRSTTAIHMLWTAPISLFIAIALLVVNLRVSALAGLGLLILGFGILITAVGMLFQHRKGIDKVTESRVSAIQEVLGAAQLVKYLAWEDGFVQRISDIRGQEARRLHAFQAVRNVVGALSQSLPLITAMVSFVTYAKVNSGGLSPAVVFSSVALFTSLRMPMIYLPLCIQGCVDSWAALGRVQEYLLTKEPERHEYKPDLDVAVDVRNATFVWNQKKISLPDAESDDGEVSIQLPIGSLENKSDFQLRNLDLQIHRGELIAIIGSVGSGKTALLSALMGSMTKESGSVVWGESYAICSQQAWVYNATVRENILFGNPYDKARYQEILRVCSMQRDLELLAYGDSTVVGERGVVLSGGQKQRISLARALYSPAETLLLDDPLSAVDANVGQDILDMGICGDLAMGRTRILCTHDIRGLNRCDRVLWIKDGRIESLDTFEKLMNTDPEFIALVQAKEQESLKPITHGNGGSSGQGDSAQSSGSDGNTANSGLEKRKSRASQETDDEKIDELMQEEDQAVRSVPWTVYGSLIKWSNSSILVALCIPALCLAQGSTVLTSLWLAWWSQLRFSDLTLNQYIGIYAALACSQAIFAYIFGFILSVCCTRSSQIMLHNAVVSLLHAPMSFFDTTPLGRHVNRFSTDVEVTDYNLTEALRMFMTSLSGLAAIFIVIIVYFHWFAIAAGALLIVLTFLAFYYRSTAREVKRFESVFRSAVFVRFIEGVKGASTIRTYGQDAVFGKKLRCALDDVNSATFTTHAVQRWLGLRQDIAATSLVAIMGVLVLVDRFKQHPSIAGLVLSLMLNAVQVTQVVVREWAEVEGAMNAVERLYEYAVNLPQEEPPTASGAIVDKGSSSGDSTSIHEFLKAGEIKFEEVRLRYRPGLPESLRGVNLSVHAGEHVAIVGRTGAGKSSMVNALFRMIEVSGGSILIDGTDISQLRLKDLRSALSIIPQEATLFSGTIRSNLDPFGTVSDADLWAALRAAAGLNRTISLSDVVNQDGANLSQGQRQLLALARALVRNGYKDESNTGRENCILVCDEATAALDGETDDNIQSVLRTAFHRKTIISIAHRLRTVLWYDRVYVMDAGQVAESGSPLELFMDRQSIFHQLCVKQGITEGQVLESAVGEPLEAVKSRSTQQSGR